MIVTIDGPAGAGKSSAARSLARRLGFRYLDTGAMYRAVALAAIKAGVDFGDGARLELLAESAEVRLFDDRVLLDGVDVTEAIRTVEVTSATRFVADQPGVRRRMVQLQRDIAAGENIVTEGRDQGTVAFPLAECKIYLTASPEERARRRARELRSGGAELDWRQVLDQQNERDRLDSDRPVGSLKRAEEALQVTTDGLTPEQVTDRLESLVREILSESRRRD